MPTPNKPLSQNKYNVQDMGNSSFDEDYGVNAVEMLGLNGNVLERIKTVNGVVQTSINDGTQAANTIAGDTGQNASLVAGARKEVTFSTTSAQAVGATDVSNYRWVSVHIVTQGTSSLVTFQGSNDNVNWVSVSLVTTTNTNGQWGTSEGNASAIRHGPLPYRYFRLLVSGISAGTTAGVIEFFTTPAAAFATMGVTASQNGTWSIGANSAAGSTVPANAFYMGINNGGNLAGWNALNNAGTDGIAGGGTGSVGAWIYNGSNWDRLRNNQDVSLLASAAQTTTQTSADIVNYNGISALVVVLDMTVPGTGSVTLSIDGKDTASGKYYNILTGAIVNTISTNRYRIGPNLAAVANAIAQDYLPRTFRIVVTANNANAATYSVGYSLLRQ